jgi:hypothetical protein
VGRTWARYGGRIIGPSALGALCSGLASGGRRWVRAGLLGAVRHTGSRTWIASWPTSHGTTTTEQCDSQRAAVALVARSAHGGLRFHDLRHSYATWLISDGVPINDVQRVMGHEQASTTLNMYTDAASEEVRYQRVLGAFAAFSLPIDAVKPQSPVPSRKEPGSELG